VNDGVNTVCIPQRGGSKTPQRKAYEKSAPFKQGQRFRAGIEGRISVLMRGRGMKRCRTEGAERFALFVGAAVLANNLMIVAALLTKRSAPAVRAEAMAEKPPDKRPDRRWSNCNCFGDSSSAKTALPVTFAPGRLRLATRPKVTGSVPVAKTMGMVVVAAFAARAAVAPSAKITATRRRTRRLRAPAAYRIGSPHNDTRPPHSGPRRSRLPLGPERMDR
jgi:hypothetical protein